MPSRIWQFSLGALVFLITQNFTTQNLFSKLFDNHIYLHILLYSGVTMIIGSAVWLTPQVAYPGLWATIPSFGAAFVIMAGKFLPSAKSNPFHYLTLVWLGDRSYSLYLWHWPIFSLGFSLGLKNQTLPTLGLVLLSLLVSMISYRFIELPFWKGKFSNLSSRRIILLSLLVMAGFVLAFDCISKYFSDNKTHQDISSKWRYDVPIIYQHKCDAWYHHSNLEPCIYGSEDAKRTALVIGDSIGLQWFSSIPSIFTDPDWKIVVLTKSACAMVDEDFFYPRIGQIYQVCTDWRNAALEEIEKIKPELIIVGSSSTYDFSHVQWLEGSSRIFQRLSKSSENVVVIPGTPSLDFDGPSCISRNITREGFVHAGACTSENRMKSIETANQLLRRATNTFNNVHYFDLNDLVCPDGICNAISKNGHIVFRDSQHLTDSFVRSQTPTIRERLKIIIKDL